MKQPYELRGVILDLDGTLLDSMPLWQEIDIQLLTENGIEPPEGLSDIVGKMSIAEWSEYFVRTFHMPYTPDYVVRRVEQLAADAYQRTIPLKPHVRELMDFFKERGIPFGVATATYKSSAEAALRRLGLWEEMQFVLTDEDVPGGKTKPGIFLASAQRLGTPPEKTLVIEDSLHCAETANRAGFLTAGVFDASVLPENWKKMQKLCTLTGEDLGEIMEQLKHWKI